MFRGTSLVPTLTFALALLPSPSSAQGYPTSSDSATEAFRIKSAETARRFRALAPRLVESAAIKAGDLVSISGGPAMVEEMEALALEVQKAGGRPLMILNSPRLVRSLYAEVPEKYLDGRPSKWETFAAQSVDVAFNLPLGEDFATLRRVDPARRARVDQAVARNAAATMADRNKGITRTLFIGVPTPSDTASIKMDYRQYERMTRSAIEADYRNIAAKGEQIKKVLEGAKRLRITSPEGTDFTVVMGPRPVVVNAGAVRPGTKGTVAARSSTLPSGVVRFAPMETSANGKLRAAEDQCNELVRDEAVDVRDGMPVNVSAASDEACLQESLKTAGRFGVITIGLNPAIKFDHIPTYAPQLESAAGLVQIGFAQNQNLGGANPPRPGGWFVPLLQATVEADGKVIVKDGKLAL